MSTGAAPPAVCEIGGCGVQAIGRCATCRRAFCASHQAYIAPGTVAVDMCGPCFAQTPEQVARANQARHDAEISAAIRYFESGSARAALLASTVQPVNISWVADMRLEKNLSYRVGRALDFIGLNSDAIGLGGRYVDVLASGRGWILGEFSWGQRVKENWLTALMDLSRQELEYRYWAGLARVRQIPEGYEAVDFRNRSMQIADYEELKRVAETVRHLAATSS